MLTFCIYLEKNISNAVVFAGARNLHLSSTSRLLVSIYRGVFHVKRYTKKYAIPAIKKSLLIVSRPFSGLRTEEIQSARTANPSSSRKVGEGKKKLILVFFLSLKKKSDRLLNLFQAGRFFALPASMTNRKRSSPLINGNMIRVLAGNVNPAKIIFGDKQKSNRVVQNALDG